MSDAATVIVTVAGIVLIAAALRDIFDILFHLEGHARLSRAIIRRVWRVVRRIADVRPRMLALAGPLGLVSVIAAWTLLILLGWALLLWPHLASFEDAAGRPADGGLLEALHISAMTVSTMGYGDVAPIEPWLRVVAPLEALIGFGLLTASVTWLFSVHPAVLRRRALAYELWLLRETGGDEGRHPAVDDALMSELVSRIIAIERDLVAIPVAYYFVDPDERFSLASTLPFLRELADERSSASGDAGAEQHARMLSAAIDDLLLTIADGFHGSATSDPQEALELFTRDHRRAAG